MEVCRYSPDSPRSRECDDPSIPLSMSARTNAQRLSWRCKHSTSATALYCFALAMPMPLQPSVTEGNFPFKLTHIFLLSCHFVRCSLRVHFRAIPMSGLRLSTELVSIFLVLDPLCEECSKTEPPRSILVIVVGPTGNFPFLVWTNDVPRKEIGIRKRVDPYGTVVPLSFHSALT